MHSLTLLCITGSLQILALILPRTGFGKPYYVRGALINVVFFFFFKQEFIKENKKNLQAIRRKQDGSAFHTISKKL
jgi:hypothetical protein